jgi:hypothetical protein
VYSIKTKTTGETDMIFEIQAAGERINNQAGPRAAAAVAEKTALQK